MRNVENKEDRGHADTTTLDHMEDRGPRNARFCTMGAILGWPMYCIMVMGLSMHLLTISDTSGSWLRRVGGTTEVRWRDAVSARAEANQLTNQPPPRNTRGPARSAPHLERLQHFGVVQEARHGRVLEQLGRLGVAPKVLKLRGQAASRARPSGSAGGRRGTVAAGCCPRSAALLVARSLLDLQRRQSRARSQRAWPGAGRRQGTSQPRPYLARVAANLLQPLGNVLAKVNLLGAGHVAIGAEPGRGRGVSEGAPRAASLDRPVHAPVALEGLGLSAPAQRRGAVRVELERAVGVANRGGGALQLAQHLRAQRQGTEGGGRECVQQVCSWREDI